MAQGVAHPLWRCGGAAAGRARPMACRVGWAGSLGQAPASATSQLGDGENCMPAPATFPFSNVGRQRVRCWIASST